MKTKISILILFILFLSCGQLNSHNSQASSLDILNFEEMENYLRTAKILHVDKQSLPGRTAPWTIRLKDGEKERRGIFKHLDRSRPHMLPDSYKYDIAAYELTKILDIQIVPPIVEREIEGIQGSLQLFLVDCMKETERQRRNLEPPDPERFQNEMDEIKVFDNLVRNEECLYADDIFIHVKDWKVCRVDYSIAFKPVVELIPDCALTRCSRKLYKNLQALDNDLVKTKLQSYINNQEVEALIKRKDLIIGIIQKLIEEKGEDAVLYSL